MESRLRKRSLKPSESGTPQEEPPKKKPKRQGTPIEGLDRVKKSKKSKNSMKHSPLTKKGKCVDSSSPSETARKGRCLLVSLNIDTLNITSSAIRSNGKGRIIQRSESVEVGSDNGSGSGSNRRSLNFKNPNFTFSSAGSSKKKNLRQLLVAEKSCGPGSPISSYSSIDAPPSFNPAKKYSDLSGFIAKYTDPLTRIYYSSVEEFQVLRTLPQDVVQGYLVLRGKMTIT